MTMENGKNMGVKCVRTKAFFGTPYCAGPDLHIEIFSKSDYQVGFSAKILLLYPYKAL